MQRAALLAATASRPEQQRASSPGPSSGSAARIGISVDPQEKTSDRLDLGERLLATIGSEARKGIEMADGGLAAIGGATVGAVATYFTARLQGASEARRLQAENRRLADQRDEEERQRRRETYHKFLTTLDGLLPLATGVGHVRATQQTWGEWVTEWSDRLSAVRLFGGEQGTHAAEELNEVVYQLNNELSTQLGAGEDYDKGLYAALTRVSVPLNAARGKAINAMRAEVTLRTS